MKEEQNFQKEGEQLDFLYGTTKEIANEDEKDLGEKSSSNSLTFKFCGKLPM